MRARARVAPRESARSRPASASPRHDVLPPDSDVRQVIEWCESSYQQAPDKREVVATTREYLADALESVAADVGGVAQQLADLLDLQADAIGDLDASLASARARLDLARAAHAGRRMARLCSPELAGSGTQTDVAGPPVAAAAGALPRARARERGVSGVRTDVLKRVDADAVAPPAVYRRVSLEEVRAAPTARLLAPIYPVSPHRPLLSPRARVHTSA